MQSTVVIANTRDAPLGDQQAGEATRVSNAPILWLTAFAAGGALIAASAVILSIAWLFPHPGQQALAALATFLLGVTVMVSAPGIVRRSHTSALSHFGAYTLLVVTLPTVRYVPFVFSFVYLKDLESLFPPLWPYCFAIPLLFALLGELALSRRQRTASVHLVAGALVPAVMLLFFSSQVIQVAGATLEGIISPWRVLLAAVTSIATSGAIILGTTMTTRGLTWLGLPVLVVIGLSLEIVSTFLYGSAALKPLDFSLPILPLWIPLAGLTMPGALTLLLSTAAVAAHTSRRVQPHRTGESL